MLIKHTGDSLNVTQFAERYPGWHSYATDARTIKAVRRAEGLGKIEVNETTSQFRVVGCNTETPTITISAALVARLSK